MPRNSSGTMTLPSGNPVVSGTVISSTTHNATLSDIAAEVTDSLSRSGKGGMTAPLRTADGTAGAPSHSFTADTDSGLFSKAAGNPALSVNGTERQEWTTAGSKVTGTMEVTGASTLTGNVTVGGTLDVNGATLNLGAATVTDDGAGNLGFGAKKLTGVADPASAQDAATMAYVDGRTAYSRKSADEAFSSLIAADVAGLSFAVEANADYEFDLFVIYASAATTTGFGYDWSLPAGTTYAVAYDVLQHGDLTGDFTTRTKNMTGGGVTASSAPSSNGIFRSSGIIRNGANAGTVKFQCMSEVNASAITVKAGSFIRYRKTS